MGCKGWQQATSQCRRRTSRPSWISSKRSWGGVVLFSSSDFVSSGTLSDSVANYDTIEVHVRDGDSNYDPGSSCIYKVTGESFVCYMYAGNTRTKLNFNGTSFSRGSGDPRVSRVIGYR